MENNIKIEYNGKWPNLCGGQLDITINNKIWHFGEVLCSTGSCYFDDNYEEAIIEPGNWVINDQDWPNDFPDDLKEFVLFKINQQIPKGCCGGCL